MKNREAHNVPAHMIPESLIHEKRPDNKINVKIWTKTLKVRPYRSRKFCIYNNQLRNIGTNKYSIIFDVEYIDDDVPANKPNIKDKIVRSLLSKKFVKNINQNRPPNNKQENMPIWSDNPIGISMNIPGNGINDPIGGRILQIFTSNARSFGDGFLTKFGNGTSPFTHCKIPLICPLISSPTFAPSCIDGINDINAVMKNNKYIFLERNFNKFIINWGIIESFNR